MSTWLVAALYIVATLGAIISIVRIAGFDDTLQVIAAGESTPVPPPMAVLDYWDMQDDRKLWRVYTIWLGPSVVGLIAGTWPATGLYGMVCAVICAATGWKAWRVYGALNRHREAYLHYVQQHE